MKHLAVLLLLLLSMMAVAEPLEVATIRIMGQPAAALVETVRPLLGRDGSVSAYQDKLIVRGSAAQIDQVRSLISDIDRPPRRLLIEVRQAGSQSISTRGIGYAVDTGNVRLGRVPPGGTAQLGYGDIQTRGRDDSLHQVQVIDGRPALIRTGQSVPVYQVHQQVYGNDIVQGFEVQYRDTANGFVALPRVHGDQVTIEIYQQNESAASNGRFDAQQASSVLRGDLGQWMTLGSIGGQDFGNRDDLGLHVQTHRSQDRQIELRVIAVD